MKIVVFLPLLVYTQTMRWSYQYTGYNTAPAGAYAVVCDSTGNIFVAGASKSPKTGYDITINALDSAGNLRWVYRYLSGLVSDNDIPNSIAIGPGGNVYVAGVILNVDYNKDIAVISLSNDGNLNWVYIFSQNGDDVVNSMTIGQDGNIYLAGFCTNQEAGKDLIVIGLNQNGQEEWVYTYNGMGNYDDKANSIVYGNDGYLYVAGTSYGINNAFNFTVISLTRTGQERWVYSYTAGPNSFNSANAITCDNQGNIYAAGVTAPYGWKGTVISLTGSGQERWRYTYNYLGDSWFNSVNFGNDGSVYVSGYCTNQDMDMILISLSESGTVNWVYSYNSGLNKLDRVNQMVYGNDGNIYLAGFSTGDSIFVTLKVVSIDNMGNERWVYTYNTSLPGSDQAYSITTNLNNQVIVAGQTTEYRQLICATVINLNESGQPNWIYHYNGPAGCNDDGARIIYGNDGNIYVGGASNGWGTGSDIIILSLNNNGQNNWIYRYDGPAGRYDALIDLIQGEDGNLYAGGYSTENGVYPEFTVISLTNTGSERWVYRYPSLGDHEERCYSLTYANGSIYTCGRIFTSTGAEDIAIIKLGTNGEVKWTYFYNKGPNVSYDYARAIVYGQDGNLYCAGGSYSSSAGSHFTIVSVDTNGLQRWAYHYSGATSGDHYLNSITYGADGNIYAAGSSFNPTTKQDFIIMSIDTAGNQRWLYRYDGFRSQNDYAYKVIYGADGNIYGVGHSYEYGYYPDITVISLTPAGELRWVYNYNGPADNKDYGYSIVYGADGNIYITGESYTFLGGQDLIVISLNSGGIQNWVYTYDNPDNGGDAGNSIIYGDDGNIYICGRTWSHNTDNDLMVISLRTTDMEEIYSKSNSVLKFLIVPTFFQNCIKIRFTSPSDEPLNIRIFDISGRMILKKEYPYTPSALTITDKIIHSLPCGIYFLRISSGSANLKNYKLIKYNKGD